MNKKNAEANVTLDCEGKSRLTRKGREALANQILHPQGRFGLKDGARSLLIRLHLWLAQKITDRLDDLQFEFIGLRRELSRLSEAMKKERREDTNTCSGERE